MREAGPSRNAPERDPNAGTALRNRTKSVDAITGRPVHAARKDVDPLATQIVADTATSVGLALTGVVNALNPRRVVLREGVVEGFAPYVDEPCQIVDERALRPATKELEIVASELGGTAGVVGAATIARNQYRVSTSYQTLSSQ